MGFGTDALVFIEIAGDRTDVGTLIYDLDGVALGWHWHGSYRDEPMSMEQYAALGIVSRAMQQIMEHDPADVYELLASREDGDMKEKSVVTFEADSLYAAMQRFMVDSLSRLRHDLPREEINAAVSDRLAKVKLGLAIGSQLRTLDIELPPRPPGKGHGE